MYLQNSDCWNSSNIRNTISAAVLSKQSLFSSRPEWKANEFDEKKKSNINQTQFSSENGVKIGEEQVLVWILLQWWWKMVKKWKTQLKKRNGNRESEICHEYGIWINLKKWISIYVYRQCDRAIHLKSIPVCVIWCWTFLQHSIAYSHFVYTFPCICICFYGIYKISCDWINITRQHSVDMSTI